ncbi:DNA alkylation repair protein [Sodaliphilus sp.]|uniref:DNA alkylation repair protein n=1 Tax=Sodaliphilus sp. TaxID=2815818 RepID=UPI00388F7507
MTSLSKHIENKMLAMHDEVQAQHLSRFFKTGPGQYGEGDKFLGIKVPVTRAIVKEHWRGCTIDDLEPLIVSPWHEIRLCALLLLVQVFKHASKDETLRQRCVEFYLNHTEYINNWDLVDLSCYEILGRWLQDRDRTLLYTLARSEDLWEQRIAIVSTMAMVRAGDHDDCIAIADILMHHKHDLIHKAVGWLLREVGKKDETRLRHYLSTPLAGEDKPRCQSMPRTMLRYAIERFPDTDRKYFMAR